VGRVHEILVDEGPRRLGAIGAELRLMSARPMAYALPIDTRITVPARQIIEKSDQALPLLMIQLRRAFGEEQALLLMRGRSPVFVGRVTVVPRTNKGKYFP